MDAEARQAVEAPVHGGLVTIDVEDQEIIRTHAWYVARGGSVIRILRVPGGRRRAVFAGRLVAVRAWGRELDPGERIGYLNGNPADLRRANIVPLREARVARTARIRQGEG